MYLASSNTWGVGNHKFVSFCSCCTVSSSGEENQKAHTMKENNGVQKAISLFSHAKHKQPHLLPQSQTTDPNNNPAWEIYLSLQKLSLYLYLLLSWEMRISFSTNPPSSLKSKPKHVQQTQVNEQNKINEKDTERAQKPSPPLFSQLN